MQSTQSVFLVEDNEITLQLLTEVIKDESRLSLVGESTSYTYAKKWLDRHKPDILLTDLKLPDGNGQQLIEQTYQKYKGTKIMVVSQFGDQDSVISAMRAGAEGYLLKSDPEHFERIGNDLDQLCKGNSPMTPGIARYILEYFKNNEAIKNENEFDIEQVISLTPREKEVLEHLSHGYKNNEIAVSLKISPNTVNDYLKNIYRKLGVHSRTEAVDEARNLKLFNTPAIPSSRNKKNKAALAIAKTFIALEKDSLYIVDVIHLVYKLDQVNCVCVLQQAGADEEDIYSAIKIYFNLDDDKAHKIMKEAGCFNHRKY